jgi:hypothetical protein
MVTRASLSRQAEPKLANFTLSGAQRNGRPAIASHILSLMAVGVICFYAGNIAMADEVLKFRIVMHATSIQTQEVGDVDGHTMSVGRYSGLASFPDGSVGGPLFRSGFVS